MAQVQGALGRRRLLAGTAAAVAFAATATARAQGTVKLGLNGGPDERSLTTAFPQKGAMVLQRTRPPLLETPFEVFDQGVFTPNDRFFVRWHWAVIPEQVDLAKFRCSVRGHVNQAQSLTMADILALPRVEMAAVNQCSGNSRGLFAPRVAGGQWQNGAMGNAKWTGVRLRDVLDRAGVKPGAVAIRFNGLDEPVVQGAPDFMKSLAVDHARDGEVMLAYQMNGEQLPLLNGFPMRLIVPGWYSTYWVKMVSDIEVLDAPDDSFWMKSAYLIPATPHADVKPGQTGFPTEPINRMVPRSFFTNVTSATKVKPGAPVPLRGIALGGDCGVAAVDVSTDGGTTWKPATLGADEGPYSFRQWTTQASAPMSGSLSAKSAARTPGRSPNRRTPTGTVAASCGTSSRPSISPSPERAEREHLMSISANAVAYGTVVVAAVALFAVGTPAKRSAVAQAEQAAEKYPVPAYSAALNARFAAEAAAVGPHAAPAVAAVAGVTLRSVGFDFPGSDRAFPPGPGAELVGNSCQSCHSPGMILNQPALTKAEWTGEVTKMLHTYKAPVEESDVPAIVAYLANLKVGP